MEVVRPLKGIKLWFAVLGGIAAWTVHLLVLSAITRFTCNQEGTRWVMDLITLVTALVTVVAMWLCVGLVRASKDDEAADTLTGNTRFLGVFGLMVGGVNLALILLEGSYALFLSPCA